MYKLLKTGSIPFIILLIIFLASLVLADEIEYYKFDVAVHSRVSGRMDIVPARCSYVEYTEVVNFYYTSGYCDIDLLLSKFDRERIFEFIKKYEEWSKKADQENISLQKAIDQLNLKIFFRYGGYMNEGSDVIATFHFLTQYKNRHQMVITFSKTASQQDKYLLFRPGALYFDKKDIEAMKKWMSSSFIKQEIDKKKTQMKKLDDQFN
ncbi:MAG: hypothetical protein KKH98_05420 [Spirochaetes bacterium]|nr:hypothetical protein [Spirochaetota bacterium]